MVTNANSWAPYVRLPSSIVHKYILLPLFILPPQPHTHALSVKAYCQDMVIFSTMLVQARSICSNGLAFCRMWTLSGPNGKQTASPEIVFEGLPRSCVLKHQLKGAKEALRWMCDPNTKTQKTKSNKREGQGERLDSVNTCLIQRRLYANCFTPNTQQSWIRLSMGWQQLASTTGTSTLCVTSVMSLQSSTSYIISWNIAHCCLLHLSFCLPSPCFFFFFPGCLPSDQPLHMGGQMER